MNHMNQADLIALKNEKLVELYEEVRDLRTRLSQAEGKVADQKVIIAEYRELFGKLPIRFGAPR